MKKKDLPFTKVLLDFLQGVNGLNHENEMAQLNEKKYLPSTKVFLDFLQGVNGLNHNIHFSITLSRPYFTIDQWNISTKQEKTKLTNKRIIFDILMYSYFVFILNICKQFFSIKSISMFLIILSILFEIFLTSQEGNSSDPSPKLFAST